MPNPFRMARIYLRLAREIGMRDAVKIGKARPRQRVDITLDGRPIRIRKGTPDLSVARTCFGGEFEVLRGLKLAEYSGVIVDAGGYIGTSAIALAELYPAARILVIEPSRDNLEILRHNIRPYPKVEVIHGALVAKQTGTVQLRNRGTGEWGFTVAARPLDNPEADVLEDTPAVTLATLGVDPDEIGLLKLDIEGGERDLFENDAATLDSIDHIFVELHDRIVDGCKAAFLTFAKDRTAVETSGEKYLSSKV